MATAVQATKEIRALEDNLNQMILAGRFLEAYQVYYRDAVPVRPSSKSANQLDRARVVQFFNWAEGFLGAVLLGGGIGEDVSYSEWLRVFSLDSGVYRTTKQVLARRWRDGKVVREHSYHKPSSGVLHHQPSPRPKPEHRPDLGEHGQRPGQRGRPDTYPSRRTGLELPRAQDSGDAGNGGRLRWADAARQVSGEPG